MLNPIIERSCRSIEHHSITIRAAQFEVREAVKNVTKAEDNVRKVIREAIKVGVKLERLYL